MVAEAKSSLRASAWKGEAPKSTTGLTKRPAVAIPGGARTARVRPDARPRVRTGRWPSRTRAGWVACGRSKAVVRRGRKHRDGEENGGASV